MDPSHPDLILDHIQNWGVKITGILTTHYHWDHAGGNKSLLETLTHRQGRGTIIPVIGSIKTPKNSACISHYMADQQFFTLGNFIFQALYTPGHTKTDLLFVFYHITMDLPQLSMSNTLYDIANYAESWSLFTGDVLFSGGCGKFFECSANVMFDSLQKIKQLHSGATFKQLCEENTLIWPGHEYTLNNLRFVYSIDERQVITSTLEWAQSQRSTLHVTIPSTLAKELQINPFLRTDDPTYSSLLPSSSSELSSEQLQIATLAHLRKLKDDFK